MAARQESLTALIGLVAGVLRCAGQALAPWRREKAYLRARTIRL